MKKYLSYILPRSFWEGVAVAVTVVAVSLCGYWSIIDRQPIGASSSEVLTPVVSPGGEFTIKYHTRWNSTCRVTGYRFVIDSAGQQYMVAPDTRFVSPADTPEFTISVPIPKAAQPGQAVYRATLFYECNPLQKWFPLERTIADRTFTILPPSLPEEATGVNPCPSSQPVYVRAYCRRKPMALIRDDPFFPSIEKPDEKPFRASIGVVSD